MYARTFKCYYHAHGILRINSIELTTRKCPTNSTLHGALALVRVKLYKIRFQILHAANLFVCVIMRKQLHCGHNNVCPLVTFVTSHVSLFVLLFHYISRENLFFLLAKHGIIVANWD